MEISSGMTEMRSLVLASELGTAQIGQGKKRRKALLTPVFQLEFPVDDCTESRDVQCPCVTYASLMYIVYSVLALHMHTCTSCTVDLRFLGQRICSPGWQDSTPGLDELADLDKRLLFL